jgi:hypothetical protein
MSYLSQYLDKMIEIEIASKKIIVGKLIEFGSDIVVTYNGKQFYYTPTEHIISVRMKEPDDNDLQTAVETPKQTPISNDKQLFSLKKMLNNATGIFSEIYLSGSQSIYGYITTIKDNYFVFYSPAYKTMFIPIAHLKWLIPHLNQTAYLAESKFPSNLLNISLANSFEEQIKKFSGEVIHFNLGKNASNIGLIKKIESGTVELVTGDGKTVHLNLDHIKSIHGAKL